MPQRRRAARLTASRRMGGKTRRVPADLPQPRGARALRLGEICRPVARRPRAHPRPGWRRPRIIRRTSQSRRRRGRLPPGFSRSVCGARWVAPSSRASWWRLPEDGRRRGDALGRGLPRSRPVRGLGASRALGAMTILIRRSIPCLTAYQFAAESVFVSSLRLSPQAVAILIANSAGLGLRTPIDHRTRGWVALPPCHPWSELFDHRIRFGVPNGFSALRARARRPRCLYSV